MSTSKWSQMVSTKLQRLTPGITRPPWPLQGHDNFRVAGQVHAVVRPGVVIRAHLSDARFAVPESLSPLPAPRNTSSPYLPYLSLDFFVVLAATFFGPPCLDFPEPWPDPPFPAFGLG